MSMLFSLIKEMFFNRPRSRGNAAQFSAIDTHLQTALEHSQSGRLDEAESIYRTILQVQPQNPVANHKLGELLFQTNRTELARSFLHNALNLNPENNQYWLSLVECLVLLHAWEDALDLLNQPELSGQKRPEMTQLKKDVSARMDQVEHIEAAKRRFSGPDYFSWLEWLHSTVEPASYVEIGVETGKSLQFARAPTKSVGIDPALNIVYSLESWAKVFKLTSDDFFAQHDLRHVLDAEFVDLAFIDGLHTFDQALKDFINIERYSHRKTVIAFHDIFPVTSVTAARDRETIFWLGDTWKVILILKEKRPDLKIFTIPTFPSGLTLVTGLNSNSTLLSEEIELIIDRWMGVVPDSYIKEMDVHLNAITNNFVAASKLLER